jgi:hypothetical protein
MALATTTSSRCPVSVGQQRLIKRGLSQLPGAHNKGFEIWLWPDSSPEIVNYADQACQEFLVMDIDAIVSNKSHP